MDKMFLNQAYADIDNLADKIGEIVFDEINEDDNSTKDMGKYIMLAFKDCKTEDEFKSANQMLIAVCGWSFESLIEKIKKRDEKGYLWESIY